MKKGAFFTKLTALGLAIACSSVMLIGKPMIKAVYNENLLQVRHSIGRSGSGSEGIYRDKNGTIRDITAAFKSELNNYIVKKIDLPKGIELLGENSEDNPSLTIKDGKITYTVLIEKGFNPGKYSVTYTLLDALSQARTKTVTGYIEINEDFVWETNSELRISDVRIPKQVNVETIFELCFSVTNFGTAAAKNVEVGLQLPEGMVNMSQENFIIPVLPAWTKKDFSVRLKAGREMENKFHNIKISANPGGSATPAPQSDGKGGSGSSGGGINVSEGPAAAAMLHTGTLVVGGTGGKDGKEGKHSKALFIVDSYSFTKESGEKTSELVAGENVTFDFKLKNTSNQLLRNIKLTVTSEGGIMPNNTSNAFYEPSVAAGGYVFEKLPLTILPSAEQKPTPITIELYYETPNGDAVEGKETVTANILQKTKLDIVEQQQQNQGMPPQPNMPQFKSFDLINLGKTTLNNLYMKVEGQDVVCENATTFVGTVNPGSTQSVEANYSFTSPGEKKVKFIFSFDPGTGIEQKVEKEYTVQVEENIMPSGDGMMPPEEMPETGGHGWVKWVVTVVILLLIILLIIFIRRAKKKKKQAGLSMDDF